MATTVHLANYIKHTFKQYSIQPKQLLYDNGNRTYGISAPCPTQIGAFVFAIATTAHFTGYIKSQLSSTDPAKLMG